MVHIGELLKVALSFVNYLCKLNPTHRLGTYRPRRRPPHLSVEFTPVLRTDLLQAFRMDSGVW